MLSEEKVEANLADKITPYVTYWFSLDSNYIKIVNNIYNLDALILLWQIYGVQFSHSVVSDSLRPHELQHARPPCPSQTPGAHSDSSPSSQ